MNYSASTIQQDIILILAKYELMSQLLVLSVHSARNATL